MLLGDGESSLHVFDDTTRRHNRHVRDKGSADENHGPRPIYTAVRGTTPSQTWEAMSFVPSPIAEGRPEDWEAVPGWWDSLPRGKRHCSAATGCIEPKQ